MAEDYVRPPTVAWEPPGNRSRTWRFRLVLLLGLLIVMAALVLIGRAVIGGGEGSPGVGNGQALRPAGSVHVDRR